MALVDKLQEIEAAMATAIDGMTVVGGYNYDWGNSNQPDVARKDAFPNADINLVSENNDDTEGGDWASAYHNNAIFEIIIHNKLASVANTPVQEIKSILNYALHDLKKLFGVNYHISDTANSIMYQGMTREFLKNGDVFVPGIMKTTWLVRYAQSRTDPEDNAN